MDEFDALAIVAELALGIAGFSGVVVVLGARPGVWPAVDRLRLATLLASGLGALFVILIALMFLTLKTDAFLVWRISSLLIAVLLSAMLVTIVPRAWAITRQTTGLKSPYSVGVFIPTVVLASAAAVLQLANTAGLLGTYSFGVLFSGLVVLLAMSGIQFVRLLFIARGEVEEEDTPPSADSRRLQ